MENSNVKIISEYEQKQIESYEKIGMGACANLYKNGNKVYKMLKEDSQKLYTKGNLAKLANIKSGICVFPNEILKDKNNMEIGYTMDFVAGKKMKESFNELSFEKLEKALEYAYVEIQKLSYNKVAFDDMHAGNIMWDEENECIKIIDTDFFKIAEEISAEDLINTNTLKFNNQFETIIGLNEGNLAKYLERNKDYKQFYNEYIKTRKGQVNEYELINKIKMVAEKEFKTEFDSMSDILEKAQDKIKEYEEEELDIEQWSEGNSHLKNLLISCRDNDVKSMYSCAGHGKKSPAYITVELNEETIPKIYSIMNNLSGKKEISFRFAQKEFGNSPNFTVYINSEKNKNEIMDIISLSMTKEIQKEELPLNFQNIVKIQEILKEQDMGFDFEYNIGKAKNNILLENLKFANSQWLEKSDFYKMGLKIRKDMFGKLQYYKNGISNKKEVTVLKDIIQNLDKVYNVEYAENKLSNKKSKNMVNKLFSKIPFVDKLFKKESYMLLEEPKNEKNMDKIRNTFLEDLEACVQEPESNNVVKELTTTKIVKKDDISFPYK